MKAEKTFKNIDANTKYTGGEKNPAMNGTQLVEPSGEIDDNQRHCQTT